jgi:cytochrome c oxidase subunit III
MVESNAIVNDSVVENKIHPQKFSLWLLIVGMIMLFAALTSAFIVKKAQGLWFEFDLPSEFLASLIIAVASSVSMFLAIRAARKDRKGMVQIAMSITLLLGLAFCYSQVEGWYSLYERGIVFTPSPKAIDQGYMSGTFVILLAALHLLHALGGIIFLIVTLIKSFFNKVHSKSLLTIDLCGTYWHFVGLLWVYLYLFLYFSPQF